MGERITAEDAKRNIEKAFDGWVNSLDDEETDDPENPGEEGRDLNAAHARVTAFLAQVEAREAALQDLLALAKAYEAWDAELIMSDEAWEGGMREFPTMTEELWDRLLEIQAMRTEAVAKATN